MGSIEGWISWRATNAVCRVKTASVADDFIWVGTTEDSVADADFNRSHFWICEEEETVVKEVDFRFEEDEKLDAWILKLCAGRGLEKRTEKWNSKGWYGFFLWQEKCRPPCCRGRTAHYLKKSDGLTSDLWFSSPLSTRRAREQYIKLFVCLFVCLWPELW